MHELHGTRTDTSHTNIVVGPPQDVHTRLHDGIETAVDPDESTLCVGEVQYDSILANEPRTNDQIDVLVLQTDLTRIDGFEPQLEERIETPVHTRLENVDEVALAKEQTTLVITNLELANHGDLLSFVFSGRSIRTYRRPAVVMPWLEKGRPGTAPIRYHTHAARSVAASRRYSGVLQPYYCYECVPPFPRAASARHKAPESCCHSDANAPRHCDWS